MEPPRPRYISKRSLFVIYISYLLVHKAKSVLHKFRKHEAEKIEELSRAIKIIRCTAVDSVCHKC